MPPKSPTGGKRKGKKSKAALEEERRQEEERLRLEEEGALNFAYNACVLSVHSALCTCSSKQQRLAEEERVRQEELEKQRQELLAALEATENERIKAELCVPHVCAELCMPWCM
eukprot:1161034-Pelagomonas_calceolata.AAC.4